MSSYCRRVVLTKSTEMRALCLKLIFKSFEIRNAVPIFLRGRPHSVLNWFQWFETYIAVPISGEGAEPISYEGERTLAAMTKFVKEHATNEFELPKKAKASKQDAAEQDSDQDAAEQEHEHEHDEL